MYWDSNKQKKNSTVVLSPMARWQGSNPTVSHTVLLCMKTFSARWVSAMAWTPVQSRNSGNRKTEYLGVEFHLKLYLSAVSFTSQIWVPPRSIIQLSWGLLKPSSCSLNDVHPYLFDYLVEWDPGEVHKLCQFGCCQSRVYIRYGQIS